LRCFDACKPDEFYPLKAPVLSLGH
jgi:hypothetical protein